MKYQVFLFSLVCVLSVGAMDKSNQKSLENSAIVADHLQRCANYIYMVVPDVDSEVLAMNIEGVRQSPMTNGQRDRAIAIIYRERLELIERIRGLRNQDDWGLGDEPSKKRRKIN